MRRWESGEVAIRSKERWPRVPALTGPSGSEKSTSLEIVSTKHVIKDLRHVTVSHIAQPHMAFSAATRISIIHNPSSLRAGDFCVSPKCSLNHHL